LAENQVPVVSRKRGFFNRLLIRPWGPRTAKTALWAVGDQPGFLNMSVLEKWILIEDLAGLAADVTRADGMVFDVPVDEYPWKTLYWCRTRLAKVFYQYGYGEAFLDWAAKRKPALLPLLQNDPEEVVCVVVGVERYVDENRNVR